MRLKTVLNHAYELFIFLWRKLLKKKARDETEKKGMMIIYKGDSLTE